jgi:hypothetical protein
MTPPTAAQAAAVLKFLPIFTQPGYSFGEWISPAGHFPFYSLSAEVSDFVEALYANGFVVSFDWPSWQSEAECFVTDPQALSQADLLDLQRLLTTHIRKDRFVEGHLATMLESGHITAILQRLAQLRPVLL